MHGVTERRIFTQLCTIRAPSAICVGATPSAGPGGASACGDALKNFHLNADGGERADEVSLTTQARPLGGFYGAPALLVYIGTLFLSYVFMT